MLSLLVTLRTLAFPYGLFNPEQQSGRLARILRCYDRDNGALYCLVLSLVRMGLQAIPTSPLLSKGVSDCRLSQNASGAVTTARGISGIRIVYPKRPVPVWDADQWLCRSPCLCVSVGKPALWRERPKMNMPPSTSAISSQVNSWVVCQACQPQSEHRVEE
ncbi:MAG: hypothetical protein JWL77_6860 [Chthonomonadaceae bacterium]|jgi:hypothetical protein|nr:hypothetical protein [Chthonomonadaceae bacterium]